MKRGRWFGLRVGLLSLGVLVLSLAGMRALVSMRKPAERKAHKKSVREVQTELVKKRSVSLFLKGFGTAEAEHKVELMPEVSGRAVYVSRALREGARVKKGALLLRIDGSRFAIDYRRIKGQIGSLQTQIKLLKRALSLDSSVFRRNERLYRRKVIDRGTYEQQQIRLVERQQRLEGMKQTLANLRGQLRNVAWQLSRTRIRAPFDARVTKVSVSRGGYVMSGRGIATLESRGVVEIPVSFPMASLLGVKDAKGGTVSLESLPAYLRGLPAVKITQSGRNSRTWKGRVVRVGARLDLSTRTVPLWVRVQPHSSGESLLPGTFCQVHIPTRTVREAVIVPRAAVYGKFVYLAVNNRLERRQLEILQRSSEAVVVGKGLSPGERLIISPLVDPMVGTPVVSRQRATLK